ncbi:MAG: PAS domain S-box protein [candidate division WOR-3 bacterium]|nr:MAG: PAS domain S-box protein [candidate division WOR-3 bacterium]
MTRKTKATKPTKSRAKRRARIPKRNSGVAGRQALSRAEKIAGTEICERLAHLLTETSVVIYAARVKGDYGATFISDNIRRLTGYSARSFLRESSFWFNHIHQDDRENAMREIRHVFESGYHEFEYRFRRKDGKYIWVHDEMRLVRDKKGNPLEIVGYWTDVTKRRRMEEEVQKRTGRILEFMESATEGFVLIDAEFNILHVNKHILDRYGWTIEAARRVNVLDFSEDLWESGRYEKYLDVLETGKPQIFEDVIVTLNNDERHLTTVAFRVGRDIGLIVQDITEQKKTAKRLIESEERLRSIYESIPAGIIFHDADGIVLLANATACEILDMDEDDVLGKKIKELMGEIIDEKGTIFPREENPLSTALSSAIPVRNAIVGIAPQDPYRKRWLLLSTEPIFDSVTSKLDEVLVTFTDFTEQKQIEEALLESEERYRHLYENSPIGIGLSTLDGKVIAANRSMLDITGYDLDEFRKMNIAETYVDIADRKRLLETLERDGRALNFPVRLRRKDGTVYEAILHISRINIGGKDCYHTICQLAS